ncbi:MAG: hypothetical protein C0514_05825 [Candidatus Puniceispirillum sp.]|nr:hypothetical protein [Candidatus Puniceispirillum sp.]
MKKLTQFLSLFVLAHHMLFASASESPVSLSLAFQEAEEAHSKIIAQVVHAGAQMQASQDTLLALKQTFTTLKDNPSAPQEVQLGSHFRLGVITFFEDPTPAKTDEAWRIFAHLRAHDCADVHLKNNAASMLAVMILKHRAPQTFDARQDIVLLNLLSQHPLHPAVRERALTYFSRASAPLSPSMPHAPVSASPSCNNEEIPSPSEEAPSCTRTRPHPDRKTVVADLLKKRRTQ